MDGRKELSGEHKNGWGRVAVVAIISFLATSGFWNVLNQYFNSDRPNRSEVRQMVQTESPYVRDQQAIKQSLETLKEGQRSIELELRELRSEVVRRRRAENP